MNTNPRREARRMRKKKRLKERRAADRQLLQAQAMTANDAIPSAADAARQTEQFGAFLALDAQNNNPSMPQLSASMPPSLPVQPLNMDKSLPADDNDVPDQPTSTPNNNPPDAAVNEDQFSDK